MGGNQNGSAKRSDQLEKRGRLATSKLLQIEQEGFVTMTLGCVGHNHVNWVPHDEPRHFAMGAQVCEKPSLPTKVPSFFSTRQILVCGQLQHDLASGHRQCFSARGSFVTDSFLQSHRHSIFSERWAHRVRGHLERGFSRNSRRFGLVKGK